VFFREFKEASTLFLHWLRRLKRERSCNYHPLSQPILLKAQSNNIVLYSGDAHVTKRNDGSTDPLHISGLLGKGNLKRSNRATSFHYYIETGDLVFSNKNYPRLRLAGNADGADAIPAHQKASDWVWDETYLRYRYHDGQQWVWQEGGEGSGT
jgi:hypothetical protein